MAENKRHPDRALSAIQVRNLNAPGRYADGNGLYLIVDKAGAKRWMLRTVVHGRHRDIGLGGIRIVSLIEAREASSSMRAIARDGGDPIAERRKSRLLAPIFAAGAEQVHRERKAAWKNAKHRDQWVSFALTEMEPYVHSSEINSINFVLPESHHVPEIIEQNSMMYKHAAAVMDAVLGRTDYLVEDRFSATDIIVGYTPSWAEEQALFSRFPNLRGYLKRLLERKHCTLKRHWSVGRRQHCA